MLTVFQEVSQMLRGNLSNQDEDEVEDELEALQRELGPKVPVPEHEPVLPNPPTEVPGGKVPEHEVETRQEPQAKAEARTPMLAS